MNKIKKHIAKIVVTLIIVGIVFILLGISMGAKYGMYVDLTGIHLISGVKCQVDAPNLDPFSNIAIDIQDIAIEFIKSDNYGIDFCYYDDEPLIHWSLENGTLTVKNTDPANMKFLFSDFSFLNRGFKQSYIKIYFPSEITLANISIKTNNNDVTISNVTAENIKINNSYGNLVINNSSITAMDLALKSNNFFSKNLSGSTINLTSDYENVSFENLTANKLYLNAKSGDTYLTNSIIRDMNILSNYGKVTGNNLIAEKTSMEFHSGDITLNGEFNKETSLFSKYGNIRFNTSKEKSYYTYDISTKYGKIVLDNETLKESSSKNNNTTQNFLKINAPNGDINVNFKQ